MSAKNSAEFFTDNEKLKMESVKYKKYIILFVMCYLFLSKGMADAGRISIKAHVDRSEINLSDNLNLKITVEGIRNSSRPSLPGIPFFDLHYKGTSSQYKIINGNFSSEIIFNYVLIPKKTGEFYLPPAEIEYHGTVYKSNSLRIKVLPSTGDVHADRDFFVTAKVNKSCPYKGEQIIYTFRFYRKRNLSISGAQLENTDFNGFRAHSLGKGREYISRINGREFLVTEVKWALFPTESGEIEIPPAILSCQVIYRRRSQGFFNDPFFDDSFFGLNKTVNKTLRTDSIKIQVKPLTYSSIPPDFSNLIGDFKLKSSIGKDEINFGDSTTLTLEITGRGNLKDLIEPDFSSVQEIKVYSDKPEFIVKKDNEGIYGKVILKKAIVPLKQGNCKIPPIQFSYFDPAAGIFKKLRSKNFSLNIRPGEQKEELVLLKQKEHSVINKEEIEIIGRDILPIHTSSKSLIDEDISISYKIFSIMTIAPFFVFLFCSGMKLRKTRLESDPGVRRKKVALKEFNVHIKSLKKEAKNDGSKLFYQELLKNLKNYLGHKMNLFGSALTPNEIERYLLENSVKTSLINEIKSILEEIERCYYASFDHSRTEKEELLDKTRKLIIAIDRSIT
ncbi:MAG: BatD family protein [Thermodesulfobacteriota bacterium]|nr:BatD family protein [Thermodesulfobacteriota bacterium]